MSGSVSRRLHCNRSVTKLVMEPKVLGKLVKRLCDRSNSCNHHSRVTLAVAFRCINSSGSTAKAIPSAIAGVPQYQVVLAGGCVAA